MSLFCGARPKLASFALLVAVLCLACTGGTTSRTTPEATSIVGAPATTEATPTAGATETPAATDIVPPDWLRNAPLMGNVEGYEAQLAYIDRDGDLRLVDAATGAESIEMLAGCEWYVGSKGVPPQWSADGSTVVCWSVDGVFAARPDEPGPSAVPFAAGECGMLLSVGPTGAIACMTSSNAVDVRTWDGQPLAVLPSQSRDLRWAPSGPHILTADPVSVHRLVPGSDPVRLPHISGSMNGIAWSRDGGTLAYWGRQGLEMVDVPNGEVRGVPVDWFAVEANRSARAYLVHGDFGLVLEGAPHPIRLGDGAALPIDLPQGWLLAVSPNGRYLAFAQYEGVDGDVVVVDLADGGEIRFEGALHVDGIDQTTTGLFSGDNTRICWDAPGDEAGCASLERRLVVEHVESPVVGRGVDRGASERMHWLAPDGRYYATMQTGHPDDAEVDLALWSFEEGLVTTVRLGSGFAYAWRPDGAYRQ